jgi:hypothetical protein
MLTSTGAVAWWHSRKSSDQRCRGRLDLELPPPVSEDRRRALSEARREQIDADAWVVVPVGAAGSRSKDSASVGHRVEAGTPSYVRVSFL